MESESEQHKNVHNLPGTKAKVVPKMMHQQDNLIRFLVVTRKKNIDTRMRAL
jgi:hypothetical protein